MKNKCDIYCVGYKRIFYPGTVPSDEMFEYEPDICEKDILCCYLDDPYKSKIEIELETTFDWCGSGYTTCTYGQINVSSVSDFGPLTHVTKDHRPIKIEGAYYVESWDEERGTVSDYIFDDCPSSGEDDDWWDEDIKNNVFSVSYDGGDSYYPMGATNINDDLFEELPRALQTRPVYIFYGESATGKSTLANLIEGKKVYETDSAKNGVLPDELWYDVIVIGNKWPNITIEEVTKRIEENAETIYVNFSREVK